MNRQLSLFDAENRRVAHIAGFASFVRAAMNRAAAASPLSREQIVERMNELARAAGVRMTRGNAKKISLDTLEKWLNPYGDYAPSLLAVEIFMRAAGTLEPLGSWLSLHGCEFMTDEDRAYRDLGKIKLDQKEAAARARELENTLQRRNT